MALKSSTALSAILLGAGTLHFVNPKPFDSIVPRQLPGSPRAYTYASGVAELAVGAAIAVPRTRRLGGTLAAALFVAVFPANVQMAVDWLGRSSTPLPLKAVAVARLPLQLPLIAAALKVRREAA
ncbi:DoxX family protein [Rhodococcus tukisamuensis]|uniref:DoxX family protein n=1 Tax=Rhodococcus tukisamuensis TaxID=168276 RepID=UPI0009FA1078|nr:MauE/DoxX family redox-associated membrane protein [Rhodococcus tukisamuensis]